MEDLMRGIIPDWTFEGRSFVDLHIYDGGEEDEGLLLFDSQADGPHHRPRSFLQETRTVDFHEHRWLLVFNGRETAGDISYLPAWLTAAGGLVISSLLFGMLLLLFKRADAQRMAEGFAEQIRGMAYHDSLTKLPNRRLLRDHLDMALAAGRRQNSFGALMLLDLDNFKPLNDAEGHAAGDALLKEVARRLRACVRETDTVARLGGDEFVVLLPTLDPEQSAARHKAVEVAEKIRSSLEKPYRLEDESTGRAVDHRCSCSIGWTLFEGHETNQSPIVKRADDAMYQAKKLGRNRVAMADPQIAAA
jgi:diguanylate cyclase (GGDEF)-like protein